MSHTIAETGGQRKLPADFYYKEYTCPVSLMKFQAPVLKSRASIVESRDPDFRPHYRGLNPLHYSVIVSPVGFAAEESQYKRSPQILFRNFEGLAEKLRAGLREDFTGLRSVQQAARSYEIALAIYEFLRVPQYEIAGIALRASWLNLEWAELENNPAGQQRAATLRRIALEKYMHAFEKEDVSKLRLGSQGVAMIVAELLREQGRFDESLQWFMRLVADRGCSGEILRNARNQMDLCKEQRRGHEGQANPAAPGPQRSLERISAALYRDQHRWLEARLAQSRLDEGAVLRALLDALKESGREPASFDSEAELARWAAAKLRA